MAMESIEIVNELAYTLGSQDNSRRYAFELDLSGEYSPSSIHGVIVDGVPTAVFAASGGATGVHDHSFIRAEDRCYLAVGSHVVCFGVKPFEYLWTLRIDEVTCFGVHYGDEADALVSHGELDISRFTESGRSSGRNPAKMPLRERSPCAVIMSKPLTSMAGCIVLTI